MLSKFSKSMVVAALALGCLAEPALAGGGSHQAVKVQVRVQVRVVPVKSSGCGKSSCRKPKCGGGCKSMSRPKSCGMSKHCGRSRRMARRAFRRGRFM